MTLRSLAASFLLLATALAGAARPGSVTLVDPAGGDGTALLAAAITAAAPGDTLLLADGDYVGLGMTYTLKEGLRILPAPGAGTPALLRLEIHDIPVGQTLVLRGLSLGAPSPILFYPPLHVFDCDGAVWLEDCTLRGGDAVPAPGLLPASGQAPASVGTGSEVHFRHCTLRGGRGADAVPEAGIPFAGGGGDGLLVDASSEIALHDCQVTGGDGGNGPTSTFFLASGRGGDALAIDGDATVAACTATGGAEGADNDALPSVSGSAIVAFLASADVRVLSSMLTAGAVQGAGTASPVISDPGGKVLLLDEPARSVVLPDQLREGEVGVLLLDGQPGDEAWVFLSANATLTPLLGQKGTLALDLGSLTGPVEFGVLPSPDGVVPVPFALPELPAGIEAQTIFVQGVFLDADGSALGGASAITWIDSAF